MSQGAAEGDGFQLGDRIVVEIAPQRPQQPRFTATVVGFDRRQRPTLRVDHQKWDQFEFKDGMYTIVKRLNTAG